MPLIRAYLDRGVTLLQGYGLSEAAPLALLLDPDSAPSRIGSAGRPPLLVGELLVRGPNVMAGYWRRPEAAREVLSADGWLRTGDAARRDDQGYVWVVDRVADRFLANGRPVYPGDVERVLTGHPSVSDAGVVRIARRAGEIVAALVVPTAGSAVTEQEILAHGRQHLAPHQTPASVTFVDDLARNSVGKIIRAELHAVASARMPPDWARPS